MPLGICGKTECTKPLSDKKTYAQCIICLQRFHPKCHLPITNNSANNDNNEFICATCRGFMFPFNNIETEELFELFNNSVFIVNLVPKKCKCAGCKKVIKRNNPAANCSICYNYFHLKCEKLCKPDFPLPSSWCCSLCLLKILPFSTIGDDNMSMTLNGMADETISILAEGAPSFSIKSLLDVIPGQKFDTDEFMTDTILSKYYTISDFSNAKFSNKKFKIFHLNIASIQKHIHELRSLLSVSKHNFDIICISETRLHDELSIVNIEIDGYEFIHKPTLTQCGGVGMYIKCGIEFSIVKNLTETHENICESIFIEIKHPSKKNILIGTIYRHHSPVETFIDTFFRKSLQHITKSKKKCIFAGDFNVDLIKYGENKIVDDFYDELSSHGFRPLILQPTRVTSASLSLIDNIFTNDIVSHSSGGNLTTSISDHFSQFSQLDLFDKIYTKNKVKYGRNWRIFNKNEFKDELNRCSWEDVTSPNVNTDASVTNFYRKVEKLLNEMAPVKKLTRKEIGLQERPWINNILLIDMLERDKLYKDFLEEKNPILRHEKHKYYKQKRNLVTSQLRKAKREYFNAFF